MAAAPCIFALGIVNTRVYNIADNLGNFGIFFLPHNWPHIVQALRLSLCLSIIPIPILNLLASSVAVVVWENIGRYVLLVIMLCSIFLPIYAVGKKYE